MPADDAVSSGRPVDRTVPAIILLVDDEESVRIPLARNLALAGYEVRQACSADEALQVLSTADIDLVITDIRMPGMDGMELLRRAKATSPELEVIVMTAYASVETAVDAMKSGARDYIAKPFTRDEVLLRVERVLRERELSREVRSLREELSHGYDVGRGAHLIGASPSMKAVFETISAVCQNRSNVLIQGETGTGKEVVAKAIHYSGPRRDEPFIALNCGSVSKTLLESQLFGHVKGAFTGAVKDAPGYFVATEGGTLFLDEITEVDTEIQVRLLRAIQEREVTPVGGTKPVPFDVRIIAATNRNAQEALEEGSFRQDLFYRLSVVVISLPPLRERREDVRALVEYFNSRLSAEYGIAPREVSEEAMQLLQGYDWPGNVRQLENVIERAFALGQGPSMGREDLPPEIRHDPRQAASSGTSADVSPLAGCTLEEGEQTAILRALDEAAGNKSKAANILGIKRKRLYRLLHKHGLMPD
jgi:DNA-binding NtrC family response regulator